VQTSELRKWSDGEDPENIEAKVSRSSSSLPFSA
jgi:hypothetical protein